MLGRFLFLGVCASLATAAEAAPSEPAEAGAQMLTGRQRVDCAGTMLTADQEPPGSRITANATIDFDAESVRGFGVSRQPIVALTAASIRFGSGPPNAAWHGNIVEGDIDRMTGVARVVVRSPQRPEAIVIALDLQCEFSPPVS